MSDYICNVCGKSYANETIWGGSAASDRGLCNSCFHHKYPNGLLGVDYDPYNDDGRETEIGYDWDY